MQVFPFCVKAHPNNKKTLHNIKRAQYCEILKKSSNCNGVVNKVYLYVLYTIQ